MYDWMVKELNGGLKAVAGQGIGVNTGFRALDAV